MIRKVLRFRACARAGYELQDVEQRADGGVRVTLVKEHREAVFRFEHYEVPAVMFLTKTMPHAS